MARFFDGTADDVIVSAGAVVGLNYGAIAAIVRRNATGVWHSIAIVETAAAGGLYALEFTDGNQLNLNTDAGAGGSGSTAFTSTTTWYFVAGEKATGSVAPRFHIYNYSTGAWTHENGGAAVNNTTGTVGQTRIGRWQTVDDYNGDIEVVGIWKNQTFTDAQWEASGLPFSLQAWYALGTPTAIWHLNQSATTQNVADLTGGGANQTTLNGTSVSTVHPPLFNVGAGAWRVIKAPAGGSPTTLAPTGLASAETPGTPALTPALTLQPSSLASAEAAGAPALTPGPVSLALAGIGSGEALGATVGQALSTLLPSGLDGTEALGAPGLTLALAVQPPSLASAETAGATTAQPGPVSLTPAAITAAESAGAVEAGSAATVSLTGQPSGSALGPALATAAATLAPSGTAGAETAGALSAQPGPLSLALAGQVGAEVLGTTTAGQDAAVLALTGQPSGAAFGAARAAAAATLIPSAVAGAETAGAMSAQPGPVSLTPAAIAGTEAIGAANPVLALTVALTGVPDPGAPGGGLLVPGPATLALAGLAGAEAFGVLVGVAALAAAVERALLVARQAAATVLTRREGLVGWLVARAAVVTQIGRREE